MKTALVYFSLTGNVAQTAERLAKTLDADLIPLVPEKAYPDKGAKKFLWGGKCALMGEKPALKPYAFDGGAYDRIIFGTPVWAGTFAPPLRTFVEDNRAALAGKRLAAFLCCSGGEGKTFQKLRALLGVTAFDAEMILVDPKDRPAPRNDESLAVFTAKLN